MYSLILLNVVTILSILAASILFIWFVVWLIRPIIYQHSILKNHMNIGEIFVTIDFIVKTECNLFEEYFQNNSTADIPTLSNSEFTNIYNTLSMNCLKAISPTLWDLGELYMNREEIQTYITQSVMQFLMSRANITEDEEEEDEEQS